MPYGADHNDNTHPPASRVRKGASRVSTYRQSQYQAKKSAVTRIERILHYFKHHRQCIRIALTRQLKTPFSSLLTYSVIAIAMTLPAGLYVLVENIKVMSTQWSDNVQISLFTKANVDFNTAKLLAQNLEKNSLVKNIKIMSPQQALTEYQALSKSKEALTVLGGINPFPTILIIKLKSALNSPDKIQQFVRELKSHGDSQTVLLDQVLINRLASLVKIGNRVALILAIVLASGILLIVGNTIRLEILNRRDEIIITKLIGANNAYIRRPLLYSGLWYGLIGGLFACVITEVSVRYLKAPIAEFAHLSDSPFQLAAFDLKAIFFIVALSAVLGWLGSWMASYRHIRQIEPT